MVLFRQLKHIMKLPWHEIQVVNIKIKVRIGSYYSENSVAGWITLWKGRREPNAARHLLGGLAVMSWSDFVALPSPRPFLSFNSASPPYSSTLSLNTSWLPAFQEERATGTTTRFWNSTRYSGSWKYSTRCWYQLGSFLNHAQSSEWGAVSYSQHMYFLFQVYYTHPWCFKEP